MRRLNKIDGFERYTISDDGIVYGIFEKQLKLRITEGRVMIGLRGKGGKQYLKFVSRLVARAFCPKPDHLKNIDYEALEVHHIDGNPLNNKYTNLMWVTNEEHRAIHATFQCGDTSKPVVQIKDDTIIHIYSSLNEASRETGIPIQNISDCVSGIKRGKSRRYTAGGYKWTNKLEGKYILSLQ